MKLKILLLTPQIPYPPTGGGVYVSNKIVTYFSDTYDLTCFALDKNDGDTLRDIFSDKISPSPLFTVKHKANRSLLNFIRSVYRGVPLTVYRNKNTHAEQIILELSKSADVIFIDHYVMYQYVPSNFKGRIVVYEHNAEFVLWKRFSSENKNIFFKLILRFEALRILSYEKLMAKSAHAILAYPNDLSMLVDSGCDAAKFHQLIPIGDDELLNLPGIEFNCAKPILLFVGTMTWEANLHGVRWFLQEVWPAVYRHNPNAEFWICGNIGDNLSFVKEANSCSGVKCFGFVEDLEEIYSQSSIFVAPLRFGSGIKIKVVNALFRGFPVVSTRCGVEGIGCTSENGVYITDDASEFSAHIINLMDNPEAWRTASMQAREFSKKKISWETQFKIIDRAVQND